jgi:hypothetical protein
MRNILLFIFVAFGCVLTVCSQEDPYDMFDEKLLNPRKNMVFTDLAYLHKPFYVIGYEQKLNQSYALSTGLMFLQNDKPYKFLITGIDFEEDFETYNKAQSKLNFFFNATFYANTGQSNFQNFFTLGYRLMHMDSVSLNDIYFKKSIISYEWKSRVHLSLNVEMGYRYAKLVNPKFIFFFQETKKGYNIFYVHVPVVFGLKF